MILKKGTVSQDVARLQSFFKLPSTGIFDDTLDRRVREFQTSVGFTGKDVDGEVGNKTIAELRRAGFRADVAAALSSYFPPKPNFSSPNDEQRKKMFGEFKWQKRSATDITILGNWAAENIVSVKIPQLVGIEGAPRNGVIQFHEQGAEQIKEMFATFEREGLMHLVISWAGSFYPRFIRGSGSRLSNHSWGTAFDINAPQNWLGARPAPVGQKGSLLLLVPIANAFGFYWGGHYSSRLDGMHFELARVGAFPTDSELKSLVKKTASVQDANIPLPPNTLRPPVPAPTIVVADDVPAAPDSAQPAQSKADAQAAAIADESLIVSAPESKASGASDTQPPPPPPAQEPAFAGGVVAGGATAGTIDDASTKARIDAAKELDTTTVNENHPSGFLKKVGAAIAAIMGGQIILPTFLTEGLNFQTIASVLRLVFQTIIELRMYIVGLFALWFVMRKIESIWMRSKAIDANTNPERGSVQVVNAAASTVKSRRRSAWGRIKALFTGDPDPE